MAGAQHRDLRWVRPPRQARSQRTLHRILDAAEALVAEKGFEDTTVAEVARRAGSSVGAFYTRFRDKEGMLYALYERYLEQATATADDALGPERWEGATVAEILTVVVRFLVAIHREQLGLIRAFVVRSHGDAAFRERQQRLARYVSARLTALLLERSAEIAHPEPELAAGFGLTMGLATIEETMLYGEAGLSAVALGDDDLASELTRAFLTYLGAPDPDVPNATRRRLDAHTEED